MKFAKFLIGVLVLCLVISSFVACEYGDNDAQASNGAQTQQNEENNGRNTVDTATLGQKNALQKAEEYLKYLALSKQGLIGQLEYEGFEEADISYAMNNLNVDWKEQCYEKAKSYLKQSAFSKQALIEQLEFEEFEAADISYAMDKLNVDWKEQCYEKAKSYLEYSAFSKQGLIDQLEFEGFTNDQIAYAIEKVGY